VRQRGGKEELGDLPVGIDQQRHPAGDGREERKHDREDHDVEEGEVERAVDGELGAADVGRARRDLEVAGEEAEREQGKDHEHEDRHRALPGAGELEADERQDPGDHRAASVAAGIERANAEGTSWSGTRIRTR
jgi:hypothetical protein